MGLFGKSEAEKNADREAARSRSMNAIAQWSSRTGAPELTPLADTPVGMADAAMPLLGALKGLTRNQRGKMVWEPQAGLQGLVSNLSYLSRIGQPNTGGYGQ